VVFYYRVKYDRILALISHSAPVHKHAKKNEANIQHFDRTSLVNFPMPGTQRVIPSWQDSSNLYAGVPNHSVGLSSSCPLKEQTINHKLQPIRRSKTTHDVVSLVFPRSVLVTLILIASVRHRTLSVIGQTEKEYKYVLENHGFADIQVELVHISKDLNCYPAWVQLPVHA